MSFILGDKCWAKENRQSLKYVLPKLFLNFIHPNQKSGFCLVSQVLSCWEWVGEESLTQTNVVNILKYLLLSVSPFYLDCFLFLYLSLFQEVLLITWYSWDKILKWSDYHHVSFDYEQFLYLEGSLLIKTRSMWIGEKSTMWDTVIGWHLWFYFVHIISGL